MHVIEETMSHVLARRNDLLTFIHAQWPKEKTFIESCKEHIKTITFILGAPRSGTSVLKDTLAKHPGLLAMQGEHRLHFTLHQLCFPDHGGTYEENTSTPMLSQHKKRSIINNIFSDVYLDDESVLTQRNDIELYAHRFLYQLLVQWPSVAFDYKKTIQSICDTYLACKITHKEQHHYFYQKLLKQLNTLYPDIHYDFYDGVKASPSNHDVAAFYHDRKIIEITPYIILRPQKPKTPLRSTTPLLLKASSDPYRLRLLKSCFAAYNLNYIYLCRNPLATINSMIDTWHHHGFGQYAIPSSLNYTNPNLPHNAWKLDLFENWERSQDWSLLDICIAQWISSHKKIQSFLTKDNPLYIKANFEHFQQGNFLRDELLARLYLFMGLQNNETVKKATHENRLINTTVAPKPGRWRARKDLLKVVMDNHQVLQISNALGYTAETLSTWI